MLPIALLCDKLSAVVVGGGNAGTRKALSLHDAGARVRIIAPAVTGELADAAATSERLSIELRKYSGRQDLADVDLVVAATGTETDIRVAEDARALHLLANVASAPDKGSFTSMAVHGAGLLTVGVSAGGVPRAAARIRDAIAVQFDDRYAVALDACSRIRATSLAAGGTANWAALDEALLGEDFCERVEDGSLIEAVARCR